MPVSFVGSLVGTHEWSPASCSPARYAGEGYLWQQWAVAGGRQSSGDGGLRHFIGSRRIGSLLDVDQRRRVADGTTCPPPRRGRLERPGIEDIHPWTPRDPRSRANWRLKRNAATHRATRPCLSNMVTVDMVGNPGERGPGVGYSRGWSRIKAVLQARPANGTHGRPSVRLQDDRSLQTWQLTATTGFGCHHNALGTEKPVQDKNAHNIKKEDLTTSEYY